MLIEETMHGLAGIKGAGRTPLRGSLVIFETIPPILFMSKLGGYGHACKALMDLAG